MELKWRCKKKLYDKISVFPHVQNMSTVTDFEVFNFFNHILFGIS